MANMIRFQGIKTFDENHQPPFIEKKFYLVRKLKGYYDKHEHFVIVNENPIRHVSNCTIALVPKIHFIDIKSDHKRYAQNMAIIYPWTNGFLEHNIVKDGNGKQVNPSASNGLWMRELDRERQEKLLEWSKLKPMEMANDLSKAVIGPVSVPAVTNNNVDNDGIVMIDLPLDIFEMLIPLLNGIDLLNVEKASQEIGDRFWSAFGTNDRKIWEFWRRTSYAKITTVFRHKIVCSYDNVLERENRLLPPSGIPAIPFKDAMDNHSWENVLLNFYHLYDKLTYGKLRIVDMDVLEQKVKTCLHLTSTKRGATFNKKDSRIIIQTCGNISFFLICPWNVSWNMRILEDLDKCEERRLARLCSSDIRYVKVMYIPTIKSQQESLGPSLPRVQRMLISTCKLCTYIRPLMEGGGMIYNHRIPDYNYTKMDPIIAIYGDVIGLWAVPEEVVFLRISTDPSGRADYHEMLRMEIIQGEEHWERIANYTSYFVPMLKKYAVPLKSSSRIHPFLSDAEAKEDHYQLVLVSLRYGVDCISVRNEFREPFNANARPAYVISHRYPEYYEDNARKLRDSLDICHSGACAYGLILVWNDKALAVSKNCTLWIFAAWADALTGLDLFGTELKVTHVEILYEYKFLAVINGIIILFQFHVHRDEQDPFVTVWPLRVINLNLSQLQLEVDQMTLDFDLGEPYIFLVLRKIDSDDALDFYVKRLTFTLEENNEEEKKNKNVLALTSGEVTKVKEEVNVKWPKLLGFDPKLFDLSSYPNFYQKLRC